MTTLKSRIMRAVSYELDDHNSEWAKGIANEHQRLRPLIEALAEVAESANELAYCSGDDVGKLRLELWNLIANLERVVGKYD